ncbi:hypothetical protein [Planococcus sp. S3-L1]|uniref:hypothetical protein n=1 Tax=Planococcus sp. S3-L1 TaxID=3046200 RepID=UPI0024B965D2|nr:hypothetical protein [Planococcus sp. S3-L1]MDJ0330103.1 hypothetical protein [Planococcus sp. S3-L1]
MFKKNLIAALFALLLVIGMGTTGFANNNVQSVEYGITEDMTPEIAKAIADVNSTNAKIYVEINKAIDKSEKMYAKYQKDISKQPNLVRQAELTKKYGERSDKLISDLKEQTEKMTLKGIEKAERAGLEVEIELVSITFADRTEKIDPIVVVSW